MELWYPKNIGHQIMAARGNYEKGFPEGAVIHYTAGRDNPTATMRSGTDLGHAYFCIGRNGMVYQGLPLNEWGSHAGESYYDGLGEGVSKRLVGIEICTAGLVSADPPAFRTYWGDKIPAKEVRVLSGQPDWGADGNYHVYSVEQEFALLELLQWMKQQAPDVFNLDYVLGHHEVAVPRGRKTDPGGALSVPMAILREKLKAWWEDESKTRNLSDYISLP